MRNALLICWIAVLGVSRVDLLAGHGGFLLTPFLALSPVVLTLEVSHIVARGGWFRVPRGMSWYFLALALLLSLILASAFFGFDMETGLKRFALLFVQLAIVLLVCIALANHPDPRRLLLAGATAGLALCILFNALQVVAWFTGLAGNAVVDLMPGNYFGVIPRLTAVSHDPNLGGLIVLAYLFVVLRFGAPSRGRTVLVALGVLSLPLTLSRSALLATFTLCGVVLLQRQQARVSPRKVLWASAASVALVCVLLFSPQAAESVASVAKILGNRLSAAEGSSTQHAQVLERAWEVGTHSVKQLLLGIGYGNAYVVLQDIFPGNRYGNFHSLFVTMFAESGAFAAALTIGIVGYALFRRGPYPPLIAAMVVYNLFQQTQTDPIFWFFLTLAWTGIGDRRVDARRREAALAGAPPPRMQTA